MTFFPPFSGSTVILDLDFTQGSSVLTGTGFAVNGSGASWTTKGFVGNGTADLRNTDFTATNKDVVVTLSGATAPDIDFHYQRLANY